MAMKTQDLEIKFEAESGQRIHRYFIWLSVTDRSDVWWSERDRKWVIRDPESKQGSLSSSSENIRTLKAALSHIRRHRNELAGMTLNLASRYKGHDVTIKVPEAA